MNEITINRLREFNKNNTVNQNISILFDLPDDYKDFLSLFNGGNGIINSSSYLLLWPLEDLNELNEDYAVKEFLTDIFLIGSDGGDTAYGINGQGNYIEVPFIGMDDDDVTVIAYDFDGFIEYISNK